MSTPVEFRKIIYFLKIAEKKSFRKAAEDLYVSPQALSKQIRELEAVLGYPLFARSKIRVEITEQGQALYNRFVGLRDAWEKAWEESVSGRTIKMAFFAGAPQQGPLEELMNILMEEYPEGNVEISAMDIPQIMHELQSGAVDLAFTALYEGERYQNCRSMVLKTEPAYLFMPEDHRLAGRTEISMEDLFLSKVILVKHTNVAPGSIFGRLYEAGNVVYINENLSLVQAIRTGKGVALIPKTDQLNSYRGIACRPLDAACSFHFEMALLFRTDHSCAEQFRKIGESVQKRLTTSG